MPAEPQVGDRARRRRRSPSGPPRAPSRSAPAGRGSGRQRASGTARPGSRRRSARPGRRRSRARASSVVWSNAPAPSRPTSSFGVKRSSTPACGRPSSTIRRAASIIATTADLLSAPRIVPPAFRTTPSSPTTGSSGPCGGTVSRCAQKKIGVPPSVSAGQAAEQVPDRRVDLRAGVVLLDLEAERPQLGDDAVGDRALLSRRAGDRSKLEEEVEHSPVHVAAPDR